MNKLFLFLFIVFFFSTNVSADSKKKKQIQKIIAASIFLEMQKLQTEKPENFAPVAEWKSKKQDCEKTKIEQYDIPWDSKGLYPVHLKEIRILCKNPKDKILMAIGDSITGGPGLKMEQTYPVLLTKEFQNTIIINAGINGSNTFHWSKDGLLFDRILRQNKDYIDGILVLIGGNNILFVEHVLRKKASSEIIIPAIDGFLKELMSEFSDKNVYLVNYPVPHVMSDELFESMERLKKNPPYSILEGPDLANPFRNKWQYYENDYIHLNANGHKLVSRIWKEFLVRKGYE